MNTVKLLLSTLLLSTAFGCTEQSRARTFGGTETLNLPCGQKLVDIFWDEHHNLWHTSRPMRASEEPESYSMKEHSSLNILSGAVIVKECATPTR